MSFIDWLLGGRGRKVEPPTVQHLFAAGGVGGVLYAGGRVCSWRLESGERVHDTFLAGPRVAWDGEQLIDSQPEGFHGLPFFVGDRLLQVGKGELRFGELVVEEAWLQPSSLLTVAVAGDGRVALLDPFMGGAAVLAEGSLRRIEGEAPVMAGCFVGDLLHLVRDGQVERYDPQGCLLGIDRAHSLQTLAVSPEGTLGLDEEGGLEMLIGDRRTPLGRGPEKATLQTGMGVLVALRDGFYVDGQVVEVAHQGLLECEEGVLVASDPPALYSRSGRCLRTFDASQDQAG